MMYWGLKDVWATISYPQSCFSGLICISTQKSGDLSLLLGLHSALYPNFLLYPISLGCRTTLWWTPSYSLDFCQESERFCLVLGPPHLAWSAKFSLKRLSTCVLSRLTSFLLSPPVVYISEYIPHQSELCWCLCADRKAFTSFTAALSIDTLCPSFWWDHFPFCPIWRCHLIRKCSELGLRIIDLPDMGDNEIFSSHQSVLP